MKKMRVYLAAIVLLSTFASADLAAISTLNIDGVIKSSAAKIDIGNERIIFLGSANVDLLAQGSRLEAAEVTVFLAPSKDKTAQFKPERVALKGGAPKVVSDQKGFSIAANSILIELAEDKSAAPVKSASAEGNVEFTQSSPGFNAVGKANRMEISNNGDRTVLTGSVLITWTNQVTPKPTPGETPPAPQTYNGSLSGDKATITGLMAPPGQQANPRIVVESEDALSEMRVSPRTTDSTD